MMNYHKNKNTQMMHEKFFKYNFEENELPSKDDMEKLDPKKNFNDYVGKYAMRCGYSEDVLDTRKLTTFLVMKCKEAEVNISHQTLKNWLTKGLPANTARSRENVYQLCFALKMNEKQTEEFFTKAYLERPFNYKDIHEAVYFFCLKNGYSYADARRIIDKIESAEVVSNPNADNDTVQIGERLGEFTTEDELLRYITENRSGFAIQNQSAIEKIKELEKRCMEIAQKENEITNNSDEKNISIDKLLKVIYGYPTRAKEYSKKSISKSNFPKLVKRNWIQREHFDQIFNEKKKASYDVIRRVLIMLTFYDCVAHAIVDNPKSLEFGIFDEVTNVIDSELITCGYMPLYWLNPFDWVIGYCAASPNPLSTLRDLIEEYYLKRS